MKRRSTPHISTNLLKPAKSPKPDKIMPRLTDPQRTYRARNFARGRPGRNKVAARLKASDAAINPLTRLINRRALKPPIFLKFESLCTIPAKHNWRQRLEKPGFADRFLSKKQPKDFIVLVISFPINYYTADRKVIILKLGNKNHSAFFPDKK